MAASGNCTYLLWAQRARSPVNRYESDQLFITYQDFLTPPTLFIGDPRGSRSRS